MANFMQTFIPRRNFKHNPDRLNVLSSGGGTQMDLVQFCDSGMCFT